MGFKLTDSLIDEIVGKHHNVGVLPADPIAMPLQRFACPESFCLESDPSIRLVGWPFILAFQLIIDF